ncbi:MAG: phosphate/phosphite/phosphonate ABC transporter substrate-binding protein, partial [Desulfobacteraceae bacterium]|nr:phosphate/phosphite/phosphonate ABC transporter substrate-binding protein [Desulfobacteraceae bacterium]
WHLEGQIETMVRKYKIAAHNYVGCFLVIVTMFIGIIACAPNKESNETELSSLRIGILPDESREKLIERYTPLFEYLAVETGVPYELIIPENYSELLKLFHKKKIDLAYFGGYTFVKAYISDNAIPLVMRDVDTRFTSYFIVKRDHPAKKIEDLKNKKFSFGSRLSTSGHLMPRHFLKKMEIVPEVFFSDVRYSGKHDLTAYWVRDGIVQLGVANYAVINKMFNDGRLNKKDVRILWETPPYPDYVWAFRSINNKDFLIKLKDAFLSLSKANKVHAKILANIDATSFLPAGINDFSDLIKVVNEHQSLEK